MSQHSGGCSDAIAVGGLRSAPYQIFIDVYMAEQALSIAICDDVRDIFTDLTLPVINQITGNPQPFVMAEVEVVRGPERPPNTVGAEQFKRFWRIMRIDVSLYFNT